MEERPHSWAGTISFWLGLASVAMGPLLFLAVMLQVRGQSDEIGGGRVLVATAVYYCAPVAAVAALVLGIIGLRERRKRLFPILGMVFSVIVAVFTIFLLQGLFLQ
jgi:cytochrome bd-type quinol oxidase subunit 2